MKVVILAGGIGTRLAPLTNKRQKCMIDIVGKPCLERVIEHIQKFGIREIIIKVHHRYEEVMDYFGERVLYYYQKDLKDENETLKNMSKWLQNDYTLVVNGDTITNVDYGNMIEMARGQNVKFMDSKNKDIYAGSMVLSPSYWSGNETFTYYQSPDNYWFDIGSFFGLNKARRFFEKKS